MVALFIPVMFVGVASLVTLASVAPSLFWTQVVWFVGGSCLVIALRMIDWHAIIQQRLFIWGFYGAAIFLLALTAVTAPIIRNTKSWFVLGPIQFQPVELMKVALILAYAHYFSRRHVEIARWQTIAGSLALFLVPAALVLAQPDLGSTLVLFGIWFGFLLVSGLPRRWIVVAFAAFLVLGFAGWHYGLKEYQRERIAGVFFPQQNALTYNYSVIQSKIAIGSAGFLGKGFGQGSQAQLRFLTEPATDFILAAFTEEWGILLGLAVIVAFGALMIGIVRIGLASSENFGKFVCLGTVIVFAVHFLLNAGSTVGIVPVVGVPFPFLSYGGSNLLTSFLLLAIINGIERHS